MKQLNKLLNKQLNKLIMILILPKRNLRLGKLWYKQLQGKT